MYTMYVYYVYTRTTVRIQETTATSTKPHNIEAPKDVYTHLQQARNGISPTTITKAPTELHTHLKSTPQRRKIILAYNRQCITAASNHQF
jgi:hypothetical protein